MDFCAPKIPSDATQTIHRKDLTVITCTDIEFEFATADVLVCVVLYSVLSVLCSTSLWHVERKWQMFPHGAMCVSQPKKALRELSVSGESLKVAM